MNFPARNIFYLCFEFQDVVLACVTQSKGEDGFWWNTAFLVQITENGSRLLCVHVKQESIKAIERKHIRHDHLILIHIFLLASCALFLLPAFHQGSIAF